MPRNADLIKRLLIKLIGYQLSVLIPFLKVNIVCPTFLKGTTVAQTNSLCYRHIERYSIRNGMSTQLRSTLINQTSLYLSVLTLY